ncbi:MAG: hypothetical protein JWN67_1156 [Actinomycetia bacterium]|nr:hypothetical protein [Actinomycetes bacterium]
MSAKRMLIVLACLGGVLAGCGSDPSTNAGSSSGKSFEEALGIDQASMQAREAKVQEAVRTCMKAEGFDYIPLDASQSNMRVKFEGGDSDDSVKDRKTKGYGITTGFMMKPRSASSQNDDPNQAIRDALSEADRLAYDTALMGPEAAKAREAGAAGGGGVRIQRRAGSTAEAGGTGPSGCMDKAQTETPGGPEALGDDLQEMQDRAEADPRVVEINRNWAACMADAGYTDFEQPGDARDYVRGKLDALMGAEPQGDGVTKFVIGGDDIDQAKLADLRQEEITIAVADGKCADKVGYAKVEKKIRAEYEQRFLDEHPDLTSGS